MCYKFEGAEVAAAIRQPRIVGNKSSWQLRAESSPVNFVVVNFPMYQGKALLPWLLKDANLERNRSLASHLCRYRSAFDACKKKVFVSRNRNARDLMAGLSSFFGEVRRTGISFQVHFAVCTAMESLLDSLDSHFGGKFARVSTSGVLYGEWRNEIRDNAARFISNLNARGLDVSPIPLAESWLAQKWPLPLAYHEAGRVLLPDVLFSVRENYGQEIVWLDVQGLADDKRVLKHVDKALPHIHVVSLRTDRVMPASEICYF